MDKKTIIITILAVLLCALITIAVSKKEPAAENTYGEEAQATTSIPITLENVPQLEAQAEELFKAGEYAKTIEIYKKIVEIDPTNHGIYAKMAHTYRYWYQYPESEAAFLKAIELDPQNAFYYTDLGKLYRNMHNFEKADWAFKESLKIDPNNVLTYSYGLGYLYFEFQRYEESEAAFLKAKSIDPTQEIVYMGLGDLYREMHRYEESEANYKKAFEINPNSESYLGLAWLYMYQKRYEEAEAPLKEYLKNIREKGEVYYALGQAYLGGEKFADAKWAFEKAVHLVPDNEAFTGALTNLLNEHPEL